MGKLSVRLAFAFLLFAVVSRAAVELIGESDTKPGSAAVADTTTTVELPPLTLIRFRHVNRRFPRGPLPLTFRRGKPCRGIHRRRDNDISYGNDMIVSSSSSDHDRQIPIRWSDFRHVEPGFEGPLHRPHHHRHHHHDHDEEDQLFDFDHHHHHDHDHHHHHHHEHENGFLTGLRKFLGHF